MWKYIVCHYRNIWSDTCHITHAVDSICQLEVVLWWFLVALLYSIFQFSPVGVAPTRTVGTSASIIFPCSIKIQKTGGGETQPERSAALC